jgi:hypothetical protein
MRLADALRCAFLFAAVAAAQETVLVPAGAVWKYLDDGTDQGTAWRAIAFDDSSWRSGPAELGYGDGDERTVVSYGTDPNNKHITTWFRHPFTVANPAAFSTLGLRVLRDDGAVVWLNGAEVFRTNLPAGPIGWRTLASSAVGGTAEQAFHLAALPASLLVAGTNVLAVEIHQSGPTSSDISFDLELRSPAPLLVTRGPYLQLGHPTGLTVRWRTSLPTDSRVRYGTSPGSLTLFADDPAVTTEHVVRVNGLAPEARTFYSVGSTTQTLAGGDANHVFATPPPAGTARPIRAWVLGDSGTADANAAAVRDAYLSFTGTRATDLWLMLGDNAYTTGTDEEYQRAVFDLYPGVLRRSVLWSTRGNHEWDGGGSGLTYYQAFTLPTAAEAGGVPSGTEAYYSFDHGNVHFICLDAYGSDRSATGAMATWLRADLLATAQEWIVAFWHHPPYSRGSHDSDVEVELVEMRQNLVPILEEGGVDLVLSGHSHSYERTFLIDGHYGLSGTFVGSMKKDGGSGREGETGAYRKPLGTPAHEGAVYVVAGSSGQISGGPLDHPAMFVSLNRLGSMVLDFDRNRLDVRFLRETGAVDDRFTLLKGTPVTVAFQDGVAPARGWKGTRDATLAEWKPDTPFGRGPGHRADGDDPNGTGRDAAVLLRWDVSAVPRGSRVLSATLTLTVTNGTPQAYPIHALARGWSEAEATWRAADGRSAWQQPGARGPADRGAVALGALGPVNPGVATVALGAAGVAAVQSWVDDATRNFGLVLSDPSNGDGVEFAARESVTPASRPKLTVVYLP